MAGKSRLDMALKEIDEYLKKQNTPVFSFKHFAKILAENASIWRLKQPTSVREFIAFLKKKRRMKTVTFKFPSRSYTRYVFGECTDYDVIQSLDRKGYFSHFTAMVLHELTDQVPKTVYFNSEQKAKGWPTGELLQANIDRAFKRAQRTTKNLAKYNQSEVCWLNGKNTNNLGVITIEDRQNRPIHATDLERTLIDIVVRPTYSGGLYEVLHAFEVARDRVSVNKIGAYLETINHIYPYHQAIGFYLERAGYTENQKDLLKRFGLHHDFYLAHNMGETEYDKEWRIHYPKGL